MKAVKRNYLLGILILAVGMAALPVYSGTEPVETQSTGTVRTRSTGTVRTKPTGTVQTRSTGTIRTKPTGTVQTQSTGTVRTRSTGTVRTKPTGTVQTRSTGTVQTRSTGTIRTKPTETVQTRSTVTVQSISTATIQTISTATFRTKSQYKKEECVKCHPARVNDIKSAGGKHRNVPCVGCHFGHPPEVKKPIALCGKCHLKTSKTHFELTGCLNCHTNPHTPLTITLKGKDACLDCHVLQQEQIMRNKSKHTALDCSACHDVHRKVPQCTKCHTPHSGKITGGCKQCHNAHMPKATYAADIPSKDCGACHKMAADLMGATTAKHKPLECTFCHKGKHRMIPACQDCHGSPHPAGIMAKFPKCGKCHNIAHDLNNWTPAQTKEVSESVPEKRTSSLPAR